MVSRRDVISTIAVASSSSLAFASGSGATKPTANSRGTLAAPSKPKTGLFAHSRVVNLISAKRDWLQGLEKLVYEHIRDVIAVCDKSTPPYDALLYEVHLNDVARSLDRCVAYRNQASDLEAQAIRRSLEYDLFNDTFAQQMTLQGLQTSTVSLDAQKKAYEKAARTFGSASLEQGFSVLHAGSAVATGEQSTLEQQKHGVMDLILNRVKVHQELLEQRHSTPGHALNYMERRSKIIELLKQELAVGYQKARAAKAGIKLQLGLESEAAYPFPEIKNDESDVGFLDTLVRWVRSIVTQYELAARKDVILERTVSLVAPYKVGANTASLFSANDLQDALSKRGQLTFSLKSVLPQGLTYLRLRGVGVSISGPKFAPGSDTSMENLYWSFLVFVPNQVDPLSPTNSKLDRSPAILGRVHLDQNLSQAQFVTGPEIWNADPTTDDWNIVIESIVNDAHNPAADASSRASTSLKDIKLHLRFVARPSSKPGDWVTT